MKFEPVYIKGMSVVDGGRPLPELLKRSQLRRCPHYVKLAANAAAEAVAAADLPETVDKTRIGTIISTGCGPQESNLDFSDTVVKEGPTMCSPTTFSFIVPNSCAGQICIINGFKGASTMLMGNNPLEYGSLLLHLKKADYILCGAVDEMTEYMAQAIVDQGQCHDVRLQEGAAMMMLSLIPGEKPEPAIYGINSMALSASPYMAACPASDADRVAAVLTRLLNTTGLIPEYVYNSANGSSFDAIEAAGIEKVLGADVPQASPRLKHGDSIGAAFTAAVVHGAQDLTAGAIAGPLLVTGTDIKGNYVAAMLI